MSDKPVQVEALPVPIDEFAKTYFQCVHEEIVATVSFIQTKFGTRIVGAVNIDGHKMNDEEMRSAMERFWQQYAFMFAEAPAQSH